MEHTMPYFPQTPEIFLPIAARRPKPSSTCIGVTGKGQPCRRPLASSVGHAQPVGDGGRMVAPEMHLSCWYCWQHKDQAANWLSQNRKQSGQRQPSLDTLVQRLDLRDGNDSTTGERATQHQMPVGRQGKEKPRMHQKSHSSGDLPQVRRERERPNRPRPPPPPAIPKRSSGFWQGLFCFAPPDQDDYIEVIRHKKRAQRPTSSASAPRQHQRFSEEDHEARNDFARTPRAQQPLSPKFAEALNAIPVNLPTKTTSRLLQEVLKPISEADEQGYIYIFWLTEEGNAAPPQSLTSSLLKPDSKARPSDHRRTSEAIQSYTESSAGKARTMLLKIGRSNNVHRRMREWSKQCGYNLSLIRYYPHVSSAEASSGSPRISPQAIRMVQHVHRVERLIHLELAEKRVRRPTCITCQKDHQEWFEIDASRKGLGAVDEVIKRWINWADRRASKPPGAV